ncbi:hypothetical protein U27_05125 [Candidatus Vecturithrix granuli]|uniref:Uncharacterized protein n=1 Tax=Vecturithrix granuli TaxID=1499967 RepID=A0A081C0P7_VECG1|nr:hypothetical protein U27_05125 [Candidatus Vecturithrix granuli]
MMNICQQILEQAYAEAAHDLTDFKIKETAILEKVEYICRCQSNRAAIRLLLACLLAKLEHPEVVLRLQFLTVSDLFVIFSIYFTEFARNFWMNISDLCYRNLRAQSVNLSKKHF